MKNKKNKQQYPKKSVTLDGISTYTLCRWAALKEAVDIIGDKCDEKNIDFNEFDLKPLDLLKYVDSMTDDLYYKVINEEREQKMTV